MYVPFCQGAMHVPFCRGAIYALSTRGNNDIENTVTENHKYKGCRRITYNYCNDVAILLKWQRAVVANGEEKRQQIRTASEHRGAG